MQAALPSPAFYVSGSACLLGTLLIKTMGIVDIATLPSSSCQSIRSLLVGFCFATLPTTVVNHCPAQAAYQVRQVESLLYGCSWAIQIILMAGL